MNNESSALVNQGDCFVARIIARIEHEVGFAIAIDVSPQNEGVDPVICHTVTVLILEEGRDSSTRRQGQIKSDPVFNGFELYGFSFGAFVDQRVSSRLNRI